MHSCIHAFIPTYISTYVRTHTHIYIHVHVHIHAHIQYTHTHLYTVYIYTYISIYIYICIDIDIHTYIYIYTHVYQLIDQFFWFFWTRVSQCTKCINHDIVLMIDYIELYIYIGGCSFVELLTVKHVLMWWMVVCFFVCLFVFSSATPNLMVSKPVFWIIHHWPEYPLVEPWSVMTYTESPLNIYIYDIFII
jgi:hypothetical protein